MRTYPKIKETKYNGKEYFFGKKVFLTVPKKDIDEDMINLYSELYTNFTGGVGKLKVIRVESNLHTAVFSAFPVVTLPKNIAKDYDYVLETFENKCELHFSDKITLSHALSAILTLIEIRCLEKGKEKFTLPQGLAKDKPSMNFRSVHLCAFPETKYSLLRKYVRLAGLMKFTHVVIEFWGTYKFDCLKELARKGAYSKKQVKILAKEANAMGVEMIPMVNIFGHAALNRLRYGKHAVLDQNPKLAEYFDTSGWVWNIQNPKVEELHKKMIDELIETFGKGKYFHLGCDEAFGYGDMRTFDGVDKYKVMVDYINKFVDYLKEKGRTSMAWADMFIYRNAEWIKAGCACNAESEEIGEYLLNNLNHDLIMVDWEYYLGCVDIPATKYLADHGFNVILAPWNSDASTRICADNVERFNYMGMMMTTWGDVFKNFIYMVGGTYMWNSVKDADEYIRTFGVGGPHMKAGINSYIMKLLRTKKNKYEDNGINRYDVEF